MRSAGWGGGPSWRWRASSAPYLVAWLATPPDSQFLGLLPYAADGHTYLAKMLQGAQGELLYHLAFTPEPHDGALVFTFYLLLGRITGAAGLPMAVGLQAARVLFGLAMLVMAYLAIARFVHQVAVRRVAFLLAAFSGGTGWVFFALGATGWMGEVPVDVHFPDATTYWTLFTFPNYSLSVALMLFMTLALLTAFAAGSWRWAVAAGLAGAALSATHPSSLVVFVVFGVYLGFLWWSRGILPVREGIYLSLAALLSAPVIVYELAVMRMNWAFQVWSDQNYCTSPSPLNMLLSFGAPAALAAAGAVHLWRRGRSVGPRRWAGC